MKKVVFVFGLVMTALLSCQKRSVPVITERTTVPYSQPGKIPVAEANIENGKTVYINRCGRCHGLPEIKQYDENKWDKIMIRMSPKAKLSDQQETDVRAYIKKNLTE